MQQLGAQLILPIALLALMYFMLIRPQQQQAKKRQEMLNSLKAGADVVTIGGLHGTIVTIDDKTVRLKVASGVELVFNRSAIGAVRKTEGQ
ncbi:MAG TPA: preprotein translocase subunit YajC [Symbiobacteriaceae bacterium]|nr:preprotein translocase subunit YajC [Symbiobacteriaceae bacterium]